MAAAVLFMLLLGASPMRRVVRRAPCLPSAPHDDHDCYDHDDDGLVHVDEFQQLDDLAP